MRYAKIENGAVIDYPVTLTDIRRLHRAEVSFPREVTSGHVEPFGYMPVAEAAQPAHDTITEAVTESAPILVDGTWTQQWTVTQLAQAEIDANIVAARTALKEKVTAKRVQVEEGGTTVGGLPVATDMGSQARLTGALNFVGRNPARAIKWKGADGNHVAIDKATIEAMSDAIGEFVAACFDAEAAHYAAIDALTASGEFAAYDVNIGWPA